MDLLVVEGKKLICCHKPLFRVVSGTTVQVSAVERGSDELTFWRRIFFFKF
jgi:hypothetical protein